VRLGNRLRLQAVMLTLQLPVIEERGTMALAAPTLANGDSGRSGDGELAPGEAGGGGVRPALTRGNDGGGAWLRTAGGNAVPRHGGSGAQHSDRRCRLRTRARVRTAGRKTGLYSRPRRRAAPPCSANRSKALRNTDDEKWALRVSDFPISINSEIDHSRGKNSQARRENSWR
jgi:hypothetical protein